MAARVTLKTINAELARLGHQVLLAKGSGYFYFWSGEAVSTLSSLTLDEWMAEFDRLKKLNEKLLTK